MSEYQRYEFMTIDRPLTKAELDEVNGLSSHIEASSTHAVVEYHWGDFKHNPITVLHRYFDGFLYWANWGSPQFALRFPHGILPGNLLEGYDVGEEVTFKQHADYDILEFSYSEMEAPDEWIEYELGSLIGIREELIEGDMRALYIAWLASQQMLGDYAYDEEEEEEEKDEGSGYDEMDYTPPVPPAFGALTAAQEALAELLRLPEELLAAVAQHSNSAAAPAIQKDVTEAIRLLPVERQHDYLVRLAQNEPGLSRLFVRELRELSKDKTVVVPTGEKVTYATLEAESKQIKERLEREKREELRVAHERRLREVFDHQEMYWRQVEEGAARGNSSGYDAATKGLVELREAVEHFHEVPLFQARFESWVGNQQRRPSLLKRLRDRGFRWEGM